jgi:hypothetical protein
VRADLLALTPETLAALTNRGLVKRATKELAGAAPVLSEAGDETVRAAFADGPVATLPVGGLAAGSCTCGASGVCRHVVGLVLAYGSFAGGAAGAGAPPDGVSPASADDAAVSPPTPSAPPPAGPRAAPPAGVVDWSPGRFTDDDLRARIGARMLARARRTRNAGYPARVRRPTAGDPVPTVELGSATVRFLVPHDLGFVHTDAAAGVRDDVLALAVWAFRLADESAPAEPDVRLDVGGADRAAGPDDSLERAVELAADVLCDGAVHTDAGIASRMADVRRRLDADGLRWPQFAVLDLEAQLAAYRDRNARYRPDLLAGHLAELHARHRATSGTGAASRTRVLGTEEAAQTPLRRVRLDGLGCRITASGDERTAEVFLAHADTATVLVLRREWTTEEDGPALAGRRVGGATLRAIAGGSVVTESAVRSASRTVRLATSRVARMSVTVSRGWAHLPPALLVEDFAALEAELDALPPRVVRPRIAAELVRVLTVAEVHSVSYRPGHQRLDAEISDRTGNVATVSATYSSAAPGALDALAAALAGPVTHVSGTVRRTGGGLVIDPLGLTLAHPPPPATPPATATTTAASPPSGAVVVPDLTAHDHRTLSADPGGAGPDPITAALLSADSLLSDAAHRGLAHLPPSTAGRADRIAKELHAVGLRRVAEAVTAFRQGLGADEPPVRAWVDAHLRVGVALDLC